jgi:hypothetical protein
MLCKEDVSDWIGSVAVEELGSGAILHAADSSATAGRESAMIEGVS